MTISDPILSDPLRALRRNKILDSAQLLFAEQGLRSTTLESIATHVGLSKSAVYDYFRNTDDVFKALAKRLAGQLKKSIIFGLAGDGLPWQRVAAALNAKNDMIFSVVRRSDNARELVSAQIQMAYEPFVELHLFVQEQIATLIAARTGNEEEAKTIAFLIFSSAVGIADHSETAEQSRQAVNILCHTFLSRLPA